MYRLINSCVLIVFFFLLYSLIDEMGVWEAMRVIGVSISAQVAGTWSDDRLLGIPDGRAEFWDIPYISYKFSVPSSQ